MEVKNQLEEERRKREVMEVRLMHDQKMLKESVMALVSHMQISKNGLLLLATIFNMITNSTTSYETSPARLRDDNRAALGEKQNLELRFSKLLGPQGLKKKIQKSWLKQIIRS